jgi:hypothetical protein
MVCIHLNKKNSTIRDLPFLHPCHQKKNQALKEQSLPNPRTLPANISPGSFQYSHAVGKTSVDGKTGKDIQEDAVFLLASQTKLLTAFSAMLVVERGLIGLDDDVSELLPELGGQKVLTGFEDDGEGGERAMLEEREGKLTLRYVLLKIDLVKWNETIGLRTTTDIANPDTSSPTQQEQPTTPSTRTCSNGSPNNKAPTNPPTPPSPAAAPTSPPASPTP